MWPCLLSTCAGVVSLGDCSLSATSRSVGRCWTEAAGGAALASGAIPCSLGGHIWLAWGSRAPGYWAAWSAPDSLCCRCRSHQHATSCRLAQHQRCWPMISKLPSTPALLILRFSVCGVTRLLTLLLSEPRHRCHPSESRRILKAQSALERLRCSLHPKLVCVPGETALSRRSKRGVVGIPTHQLRRTTLGLH